MENTWTTFEAFYEETRTPVFRAVLTASGARRDDAEEAVAEAFARAYLRWDKLRGHPNPAAWVVRTAFNHRISVWRRTRREVAAVRDAAVSDTEGLDDHLTKHIARLPRGQREVLALRILLDLSTEQTAAALRVSEGTVKTQLHRALSALRRQLSVQEPRKEPA